MDAESFEALLRAEVALRDQRIASRAFHPTQRLEADEAFVAAIMTAAGCGGPADGGRKLKTARRARQRDEDRAFAGRQAG